MQATILCLECNKQTVHFELGTIIYMPGAPVESLLVKKLVVCPKCKQDISNQRFAVGEVEFLMCMVTANMLMGMGEPQPPHLKGIIIAKPVAYNQLKAEFHARPRFVKSVQRAQRKKKY